jgi:presenilin-like A22 family membrane protease
MNLLTAFGAIAVTAMLLFYALEARRLWFVLAFAGACLASSLYAFLQGAWPFGVVEVVWCGVAVRRWWRRRQITVDRIGSTRPDK